MKAYSTSKCNYAKATCFVNAMAMALASMFFSIEPAYPALIPNLLSSINNQKIVANPQATAATPDEIRAELKRKLIEVQSFRDRLESGSNDNKAPEGIKPEEITEQRRLIDSLIFFYQEGLNSLIATDAEREKLKTSEALAREWTGFPDPPPYSMLMLYGLQDEADALRGQQAALESLLAGRQGDSANQQMELSQVQAAFRMASENRDHATNADEVARASWRRDYAEWRVRAAERNIWFEETQTALVNAKLSGVRSELALLEKKIDLARRHAVLSNADMDKVHESLKVTTQGIEQEQQRAISEKFRWVKERETAERNLGAARDVVQKNGDENPYHLQIERLEARLRTADAWVDATNHQTESLGTLVVINNNIGELWNYQNIFQNSPEPKLRQNAMNQLERDLARLHQWSSYTQDSLRLAVSEERNQQAKLDGTSVDSPLRGYEMQTLEAYRLKRQNVERIRLLADRTEHMLDRWQEEYRQGFWDRPFAERFKEKLQSAVGMAVQISRFELFTVDDEVDLEGKKFNITRGVTLGKSFTALVVFVVGFWLAKWLSRRFQQMLVKRFDIEVAQSNVLKRWFLMGLSLILLATVLTLARIPLTALAFLGGALAIGVGFGTQTMLKNLISGVMILVERKIQIGDIIEVDGIVGTISEIDIRSSTVRGFDGVETMIPNSTFLENKVTNWTYTNLKIRRSVRVGIAYGSSTREVIRLLLECADRHGQVLDDPKPFVWLEDFGSDSLVFGLYFWLEMAPMVSSLQVMSDLRCMIIDKLSKAGIAIPFPQRDIHFDSDQPVPVSVVSSFDAKN